MSGTQVATSSSQLTYAIQGYNGINLTNWTTSAASVIAAGSGVEVAGAFFRYSSDDTNDATSFSAIATNATAYLQLEPSGTVGSQIVTSSWTATAPTWVEAKNGWYASAASATRYVAGCVKTGTTSYENKFIITPRLGNITVSSLTVSDAVTVSGAIAVSGGITENSRTIKRKTVDIGNWNMDASTSTVVSTGITGSSIKNANVYIISDNGLNFYPLYYDNGGGGTGGYFRWDTSGDFTIAKIGGGFFDTTAFDSTSFNRGYVSIEYEV
jgi:hypothetical protein